MIDQESLKSALHYDPDTGFFVWLISPAQCVRVGTQAGTTDAGTGYHRVMIRRKKYQAHRLAWLYMTGEWPTDEVDHINGVRTDNRWANLRSATKAENQQNAALRKDSSSALTGAQFHNNKWQATIRVNGTPMYLGVFADKLDARKAYLDAKARFHTFNPVPRASLD